MNTVLSRWGQGLSLQRRGAGLALGAISLIMLELTPFPYPQLPADIPEWYHSLGQEEGDFSILELPPQDDYWHGAYRMYFQTAHGKPIFGGYISREFRHPFIESTPGYMELHLPRGGSDMLANGPSEWHSAFADYRTKYIVLQKDRLPDDNEPPQDVSASRKAINQVLPGVKPLHSDKDLEVYLVPPPTERVAYLQLGEGWQPHETGPNGSFRWMESRATLQIRSPDRRDSTLLFRATNLGYPDAPRRIRIAHGDHTVFEGEISGLKEYAVGPLGLPQGDSVLTFSSLEGTGSPKDGGIGNDPRLLSFAFLDVRLARDR